MKNNEKNAIIIENNQKKRKKTIILLVLIGLFLFALFMAWNYFAYHNIVYKNKFYDGTKINGVDVSNMSYEDASNLISSKMSEKRDEIEIEFVYDGKTWDWKGSDFEVNTNILPVVEQSFRMGRNGNAFERLTIAKKIQSMGFDVDVSYKYILTGFDQKLDTLIAEIEKDPIEPVVSFSPDKKPMFRVEEGVAGVKVDKTTLCSVIDAEFEKSTKIKVEIPTTKVEPKQTKEQVEKNLVLRSSFKTSYASSIPDRKSNVKLALSKFNGKVVLPEEEVSFNQTTGARTKENGYKKANIILNGVFIEGTGGGVCQASTTLYNALIRADLDIVEVNKHSLPVSYVPLAFDAMVSEGFSDLVFKNNLDCPIYLKAWGDNEKCYVEIYGKPFENGMTVEPRAEFVKTIPHTGDRIVKDENGEYADKVLYKGEYFRVKYPHEGYESSAYLDYYSNGELVESKLLRHETYLAQEGIVVEGVETLGEGMTLPENKVSLIAPQKASESSLKTVSKKIEKENQSKYNP